MLFYNQFIFFTVEDELEHLQFSEKRYGVTHLFDFHTAHSRRNRM